MQVRPEQIDEHLKHNLAPVYLITGDEPLQVMETADAVRRAAAKQGFSERDVLSVDPQFDWSSLYDAAGALSLFAERKLLDAYLQSRGNRCQSLAALFGLLAFRQNFALANQQTG